MREKTNPIRPGFLSPEIPDKIHDFSVMILRYPLLRARDER